MFSTYRFSAATEPPWQTMSRTQSSWSSSSSSSCSWTPSPPPCWTSASSLSTFSGLQKWKRIFEQMPVPSFLRPLRKPSPVFSFFLPTNLTMLERKCGIRGATSQRFETMAVFVCLTGLNWESENYLLPSRQSGSCENGASFKTLSGTH